jgi:TPR repeat protein
MLGCVAAGPITTLGQPNGEVYEEAQVLASGALPARGGQSLLFRAADQKPGQSPIASVDVTDAYGEPGKPLALQVELPQQSDSNPYFVNITGIPADFVVSQGTRSGGGWLFAANALKGLTITAPFSFHGRFTIAVKLFSSERKLIGVGMALVTIRERKAAQVNARVLAAGDAQESDATPPEARRQTPGSTASVSPEKEASQLKRSEDLLKSGDISAARLILETLSDEGSGQAAYLLGRTYDPIFFSSNFIRGMAAEPAKAAFWYKRALELGNKEAGNALLRLESSN